MTRVSTSLNMCNYLTNRDYDALYLRELLSPFQNNSF